MKYDATIKYCVADNCLLPWEYCIINYFVEKKKQNEKVCKLCNFNAQNEIHMWLHLYTKKGSKIATNVVDCGI